MLCSVCSTFLFLPLSLSPREWSLTSPPCVGVGKPFIVYFLLKNNSHLLAKLWVLNILWKIFSLVVWSQAQHMIIILFNLQNMNRDYRDIYRFSKPMDVRL